MTNDKDSAVLLPCPFCGGVQIKAFHHIDRGWGASWHVECVAEECGNSTCHHGTEAAAITAWNTRQPTQSDALLTKMNKWCKAVAVQWGQGSQTHNIARDAVDIVRAALQEQSK
jgi:hypothetical protein